MKSNNASIFRQATGIFLVSLMLIVSFLTVPVSARSFDLTPDPFSEYEYEASGGVKDLSFIHIKHVKANFVKTPSFSKIAEKLAEAKHVVFNEIYFIPYPQTLSVNDFSRNSFYVFVSTKAP